MKLRTRRFRCHTCQDISIIRRNNKIIPCPKCYSLGGTLSEEHKFEKRITHEYIRSLLHLKNSS